MPDAIPLEASMYPTMATPPPPGGGDSRAAPKGAEASLDALERAMYPSMHERQGADAKGNAPGDGGDPGTARVEDAPADKGPKSIPGLPEGFTPGPGFEEYQTAVKDLGLAPDASVRLLKTYQAAQDAQRSAWAEAATADPEIGGASFQRNLDHARSALKEYGSPGLTEVLERTGLGNQVEIIRLLAKVGRGL
jgi:hypothetical protein